MKKLSRWKIFVFGTLSIGVSLALLLVGAEIVLRLVAPHRTLGSLIEPHPVFGYRMLKDASTHYYIEGRYVGIRTNANGLRQDDPIPEKNAGEKRVLVLGDSFTFGWGVELEESFVHRLRGLAKGELKNDEWLFINSGHGGWGTAHMLAYLEREGLAFQPDVALLFMGHNDIEDNERNPAVYRQTGETELAHDESLLARQNNQSGLSKHFPVYQWLRFHSYLVQMYRAQVVEGINQLQNRLRIAANPTTAPQVAKAETSESAPGPRKPASMPKPITLDPATSFTRALLVRIRDELDRRGVPLVVLSVGTGSPRTLTFWKENGSWLREHGVTFHDLTDRIQTRTRTEVSKYYLPDGHFTAEGNRVFTEEAWPIVKTALAEVSTKRRSQ